MRDEAKAARSPLSLPSDSSQPGPVEAAAAADARELNQFEADGKVERRGGEDREEGMGAIRKADTEEKE